MNIIPRISREAVEYTAMEERDGALEPTKNDLCMLNVGTKVLLVVNIHVELIDQSKDAKIIIIKKKAARVNSISGGCEQGFLDYPVSQPAKFLPLARSFAIGFRLGLG